MAHKQYDAKAQRSASSRTWDREVAGLWDALLTLAVCHWLGFRLAEAECGEQCRRLLQGRISALKVRQEVLKQLPLIRLQRRKGTLQQHHVRVQQASVCRA